MTERDPQYADALTIGSVLGGELERDFGTAAFASEVLPGGSCPSPLEAYQFHASANFLFTVLKAGGDRFEHDYTAFVIYCAFMVAAAADTLRDVSARRRRVGFAPGVLSANSISAMTGIPRETVRRKCLQLVEQGLFERYAGGQFRCIVGDLEAAGMIQQFQQVQPFR